MAALNSKGRHKKLAIAVHVYLVVLQRTAKKCTKIYSARVESLFQLLFGDALVAVAVVGC